jgi:tetratricopeptide (TPR) repeat protein
LKGIILLHENKPDESIDYFRKAMNLDPDDWQNLMYIGLAHTVSGRLEKGYRFLRMAAAKRNEEPLLQLWLAQNRFIVGRNSDTETHLEHFITLVGARNVENYFSRLMRQFSYMEASLNSLRPLLAERLQKISDDIGHTSRLLRVSPAVLTKVSESEMSIAIDNDDGSPSK